MKIRNTETNAVTEYSTGFEAFAMKLFTGYVTGADEEITLSGDTYDMEDEYVDGFEEMLDLVKNASEIVDLSTVENIGSLIGKDYFYIKNILESFAGGVEQIDVEYILGSDLDPVSQWNYIKMVNYGLSRDKARAYVEACGDWMKQSALIYTLLDIQFDPGDAYNKKAFEKLYSEIVK